MELSGAGGAPARAEVNERFDEIEHSADRSAAGPVMREIALDLRPW